MGTQPQGGPARPPRLRRWLSLYVNMWARIFQAVGWPVMSNAARRRVLLLDPTQFMAWVRHAEALRLLGRRSQGLACIRRAERLLIASEPSVEADAARRAAEGDIDSATLRRAKRWGALGRSWLAYSKREAAREALMRAMQLAPRRAGPWLAYAQLMRQLDEPGAAIAALRRAAEAEDSENRAQDPLAQALAQTGRELSAAAVHPGFSPIEAIKREAGASDPIDLWDIEPPSPDRPEAADADIVLDLSDLLVFLHRRRFVSGIQRVQAELALRLLDQGRPIGPRGRTIHVAQYDGARRTWRLAEPNAVIELVDGARGRQVGGSRTLARMVETVERSNGGDFESLRRPVLFNPGASWSDWRYLLSVREIKRRLGARYVPFVHDCIPLILPQTCSPDVPPAYSRWLAGAAELGDAFLVNSKRTAEDLRSALAGVTERNVAIGCIGLDGRTEFAPRPATPHLDPALMRAMRERGFALCVGSIEPRKRHLTLFRAWRNLMRKHGARAPLLLIIGRPGWREDRALDFLDETPELEGTVVLLQDVPDAELSWYYANARFSICASLYEGWGMPITEALNAGLPTLTARNSALTESGGDAVEYFDTENEDQLYAQIEALSFDRRRLHNARERARAAPLRDWADISGDVLKMLREVAARGGDPRRMAPMLAPGTRYDFSNHLFGRELAVQEGGLFGHAWGGREPGGIWTLGGAPCRLAFRVPSGFGPGALTLTLAATERDVQVFAQLRTRRPHPNADQHAEVKVGAPLELSWAVDPQLAPDGFAEIVLETGAEIGAPGVAVSAIELRDDAPPEEAEETEGERRRILTLTELA